MLLLSLEGQLTKDEGIQTAIVRFSETGESTVDVRGR